MRRSVALIALLYGWLITFNLSSISSFNSNILMSLFYTFFCVFAVLFIAFSIHWIVALVYTSQRTPQDSLIKVIFELEHSTSSALVIIASAFFAILVFIFVFTVFDVDFAFAGEITLPARFFVEITRSLICTSFLQDYSVKV